MVPGMAAASEMGGRKMTREEAAKRFREKAEDHYYVQHLREMYLMAAEALEEKPADHKEILVALDGEGKARQVWKTEIYFGSEAERDKFDRKLTEGWCPLEWIDAEEELPAEEGKMVLCVVNDRCGNINFRNAIQIGYYDMAEGWVLEAFPELENPNVTHWMELPEGPEVE